MSTPSNHAVLFGGRDLTVEGVPLTVGDHLPDVALTAPDLTTVSLAQFRGRALLISVVPSLDTGVCDAQTRRFNDEAARLGDAVRVITISADLPFAQRRWLTDAAAKNIVVLSDHRTMAFGDATGTRITELRLLQRAIFVVDGSGVVRYVEYVRSFGHHPDYDAAVAAARALPADTPAS